MAHSARYRTATYDLQWKGAVAVPVTVLVGRATSSLANAQELESESDDLGQRMHVEARSPDDGRTEFELRLHDAEDRWEDR